MTVNDAVGYMLTTVIIVDGLLHPLAGMLVFGLMGLGACWLPVSIRRWGFLACLTLSLLAGLLWLGGWYPGPVVSEFGWGPDRY